MSHEKTNPAIFDMTGRVLSLEQRVKGLNGRIAAIEARLSGGSHGCNDAPVEDFVPAASQCDRPPAIYCSDPGDQIVSAGQLPRNAGSGIISGIRPGFDLTGLIAGAILIGAGILLLNGNVDIIKNPLVAMGCGIMLMASALNRRPYKNGLGVKDRRPERGR